MVTSNQNQITHNRSKSNSLRRTNPRYKSQLKISMHFRKRFYSQNNTTQDKFGQLETNRQKMSVWRYDNII